MDKEKQAVDDQIKGRYGLPETLCLVDDDEDAKSEARVEWEKGRRELAAREKAKRRRLSVGSTALPISSMISHSRPTSRGASSNVLTSLRARILENTARQSNSFGQRAGAKTRSGLGLRE